MFSLAELVVQITGNSQPLNQTLAGVKGALMGTVPAAEAAGAASGRGYALAFAGAVAGAAALIGAAVFKAVTMASDLNETTNKLGVIFGDQAGTVSSAANQMAEDFGVVKTSFMDASAEIGNLLEGMGGQSRKAAAEMSVELTRAAADASSIFNVSFEEATEKIGAALRGQSEPISAFGVDVQEAAVKADALAHGAKLVNGELTTQDKVAARTRVVLAGLAVAHGDLANTSAGFANSSRALWGRMQNAAANFGQAILPIFEALLGGLNRVAAGVAAWVDASMPQLEAFADAFLDVANYVGWGADQVGQAVLQLGAELAAEVTSWDAYKATVSAVGTAYEWLKGVAVEAFEAIGVVFRNWHSIVAIATIRARQYITNAGEAMAWLGDAAGQMLSWFASNWQQLFADIFNGALTIVRNFVTNVSTNLKALWEGLMTGDFQFNWTPLLEGFKATVEKLPDVARPVFTDLQKEIDDELGKVGDVELKRAEDKAKAGAALARAPAGPPAGDRGKPAAAPAKEKEKTEVTDLAGFAKNLLEANGKDKAAKDTAKSTKELVVEAAKQTKILGQLVGGGAMAFAQAMGPA